MNRIDWLERQLVAARQFLREDELIAERNPGRSAAFFVGAKGEQIRELERELSLAKSERAREVLEIRLHGEQVNGGTIPLHILGRIAAPFGELLASAALRQASGQDTLGQIPASLRSLLDLRLAGLGSGSTRLMITGNLAPDLAGDSLLEVATKQVFSLLNSPADSFFDAVDNVGTRAASRVNDLLTECERYSLGIEISWTAPNDTKFSWLGRNREIARVRELLDGVEDPIVEERILEGEVRSLSLSGRIELMMADAKRIAIRYPKDLVDLVKSFHLGQIVALRVQSLTYLDKADRERLRTHHLTGVAEYLMLRKVSDSIPDGVHDQLNRNSTGS